MWQAPNLIGSEGNWLLAYTGATTESGSCLFFYDIKRSKTIARISGAELLVNCYSKNGIRLSD